MGDLVHLKRDGGGALDEMTLGDLLTEAEKYGRVTLFGDSDVHGTYRCKIEFQTTPGSKVEAASDFGLPAVDALIQGIRRAGDIAKLFGLADK